MAINRVGIVATGMKSFAKSVAQANTALGLPPASPPSKTVAAGTTAKTELTAAKTELNTAKTELNTAKTELNTAKTELSTTKTELTTTKSELTTTKTELSTTKTELATAKNNLTGAQSALESANSRIDSLLAEIEGLKSSLAEGGRVKITNLGRGTITESEETGATLFNNAYIITGIKTDTFNSSFCINIDWKNPQASGRKAFCAAFESDGIFGIDNLNDTPNMWAGYSGWNLLEADSDWSPRLTDGRGRGSIGQSMMHSEGGIKAGGATRYLKPSIDVTREGDWWTLYVGGVPSVRKERSGSVTANGVLALGRWGSGDLWSSNIEFAFTTSAPPPAAVTWVSGEEETSFAKEGLSLHIDGAQWPTRGFGLFDRAYGHNITRVGGGGNDLSFDGTGYLRVDPIGIELIPWDRDFWVEFSVAFESTENTQLITRIGNGENGIDIGLKNKKLVIAWARSFGGSSYQAELSDEEFNGGVVKISREGGIVVCDINGVRQSAATELFNNRTTGSWEHSENCIYIGMDPEDGDKGLKGSLQYFKMSDPYYEG